MSDFEKIKNVPDGDLQSVEEICSSTWEPIYRFIYFKVQNREEAEDITQETYVKALSYLQSNRINPNKYFGFLKTVALNVLRDRWRKTKRQGTKVDFDLINPMETASEDPAETSAQRLIIENALRQLNDEQRTVIQLRIIKGFSVAEAAKMMEKTEVTIRVMQHRALQVLAKILKHNH